MGEFQLAVEPPKKVWTMAPLNPGTVSVLRLKSESRTRRRARRCDEPTGVDAISDVDEGGAVARSVAALALGVAEDEEVSTLPSGLVRNPPFGIVRLSGKAS